MSTTTQLSFRRLKARVRAEQRVCSALTSLAEMFEYIKVFYNWQRPLVTLAILPLQTYCGYSPAVLFQGGGIGEAQATEIAISDMGR